MAMTTTTSRTVLLAGAFMVVLDFFIVNVALPAMAAGLHAGSSTLEWVVAGYGLSFAAFLITAGRLGDGHGRRRMYGIGLTVFTLASLACGLAPTAETLVLARVVQGVGGAIVMPQVLGILATDRRGLTIFGLVAGLAAVGGQVIGGALVETVGWRACFLINVPIGIAALALLKTALPETAKRPSTIDPADTVLLAAGLTAVLLPLIEGRQHGWPAWTFASLAAAPVLLGVFLRRQQRRPTLLDLSLFRERGFSAGLATQLCLACAQAAFFVYLALYLQGERHLTALQAGLVFTILAAAYVVVSGPATNMSGRGVVALGGGLFSAGLLALVPAVHGPLIALVPGLVLAGAGIGFAYTPLTTIVLSTVPPARAGGASGAMSTTQQLGYALGVAVTGIVYFADGFATSLIQLAAVAAGVVVAALALPVAAQRAGVPEPVVVGLG